MAQALHDMASLRGRSERLREFVEAAPLERLSIYRFIAEQADLLAPGVSVLDVGAGDAPYRELFDEHEYVTLDHADTMHSSDVDLHGHAEAIPVADGSFDVVLCTQVLEHVPEPGQALREFRRVLRPDGVLLATMPFLWEEHEAPNDYYRYTRYGIEHLAASAGFGEVEVTARTDCFTTLAQLLRNARWTMGSAPDGMDPLRHQAGEALEMLAEVVLKLAPLDVAMVFPLGFNVRATVRERSTAQ